MPEFKPVTLNDKDRIDYYLSINQYKNSEYSFGSLFAWQKTYDIRYAIIENCLCLVYSHKGTMLSYFPLGEKENFLKAYTVLSDHFASFNARLDFSSLSEPMIQTLNDFGLGDCFESETKRDFFDYVYTWEKLTGMRGKKLNGKRNHYNYFINNNQYELRDITKENEEECEQKFEEFILGRSIDPVNELEATLKMLHFRNELGLSSKTLYANGELVGIILGGKHHNDGLIHIAKSNVNCRGASVALFKHYLEEHLTDCAYINLMEDMGIEGLRKSKSAYRPDMFVEKYEYKLVQAPLPMVCACATKNN